MLFFLLAAAGSLLPAAAAVSVQLEQGAFVVHGWTPPARPATGWESVLSVYAGDGKNVPAMLGDYVVRDGKLTFQPRYSPSPGMRVRAVFEGKEYHFEIPSRAATPLTFVERVYPTGTEIPENHLKFYVEFSTPMSRGLAWKHIHLLKADGTPVDLPFLEIEQEMWDAGAKRLTVLFDPGRIKRGVKPLEDIGPAIESGHSYALVIDREWPDATGAPLVRSYRKEFRVTTADREPIDPSEWQLGTVSPGTREALTITFPEPLDAALAARLIRVRGVSGRVSLTSAERQWQFEPDRPWQSGDYFILVDSSLEDLAGNKVGRPFDVDTFDRVARRVSPAVVSIPFRIGRR
jgi:hypothetical protein